MSVGTLPAIALANGTDGDGLYEIIDGVRTEKPSMGFFANVLASYLTTIINMFALPKRLGMAINETMHKSTERSSRRPDISFVEFSKWPSDEELSKDPAELDCSPNLAIEVVSPSNTIPAMEDKILEYFDSGVQLVWIVHPRQKRIYVYESPKDCTILDIKDTLEGGRVLPGFALKLADLFSARNLPA